MTSEQPDKDFKDILRLAAHLPSGGDTTLTLLKGHLLIEELLREMINSKLKAPEALSAAKLEFDQCIALGRALTGNEFDEWYWVAIKKLNKIRNDLAHNLEPKGLQDRVDDFVKFVDSKMEIDLDRGTFTPLAWALAGLFIGFSVSMRRKQHPALLERLLGPSQKA